MITIVDAFVSTIISLIVYKLITKLDKKYTMCYFGGMIKSRLDRVLGERHIRSITELARLTGLSRLTLYRFYNGADRIRYDTLDKVCKALHCQVGELLEYVPDETVQRIGEGSGDIEVGLGYV